MTHLSGPESRDRGSTPSLDETIEVELNPKDILPAPPVADGTGSGTVEHSGSLTGRRWPATQVGVVVGAAAAIVAFASVAHHTTTPSVSPPPVAAKPSNPPPSVQPAPSTAELVHFKNPFDPSETFDFPAGTSEADAREAVAQLLLQRASERRQALRVGGRRPSRSIAE